MNRIRRIRQMLIADLARYQRLGVPLSILRGPPNFEPLFEDTIRGYSLLELGARSY